MYYTHSASYYKTTFSLNSVPFLKFLAMEHCYSSCLDAAGSSNVDEQLIELDSNADPEWKPINSESDSSSSSDSVVV